MDDTLHLLLALCLVISALVVVMSELVLGRRPRIFTQLHTFSILSAVLLVPSHVVNLLAETGHAYAVVLIMGSWVSLLIQVGLLAFGASDCQRIRSAARGS